jgi:hypothetical protein
MDTKKPDASLNLPGMQMATNNASVLLIDNCSAADFELLCPKTWGSLRPGHVDSVRHCDACNRNVYLCRSDDDLKLYDSLGYCVAISQQRLEDRRRPVPPATQSTTDAVSSPVATEKVAFVGVYRRK